MTLRDEYRLEDRYDRSDGRVFMTSIQALARVPAEQLLRDRAAGLDTAAFLSGYPGSPLGGFDMEVGRMLRRHPDLPIVHRPAVNEELGASAVMGSQLSASRPDAIYDGVVGVWYGKSPGLDRATDAIRHGVFAGKSPRGGVVALVGDDPAAKSSTMPSSSDAALVDLHMPILYPGDTAECLELGLHAVAISRASGLWAAMKIVTPVADGSGTVDLPVVHWDPVIPEHDPRPDPSAVFLGSARMVAAEEEFRTVRAQLAYRYGVENRLNRIAVDPPDAWIGLVATGYTYRQMREALRRLGFADDRALASAGIRLLQLRMPVPFDAEMVRRFALGLEEIVVVEEKNPTLEWLVKDTLYDLPDRPRVLGKSAPDGRPLIPVHGLLDADAMLPGLRDRLATRLEERMAPARPARSGSTIPLTVPRTPFFCSGCPHNRGTKVPDGALVGAGTGCHGMSLLMPADLVGETFGITAMGNEGAHWIGMQPFVGTDHVFQNFGDGTYFHSGQLAIQAAIGAGVSMTFKILYNSTVAMTGGQDPSFAVGVPELASILLTQGVREVVVATPDVSSYDRSRLPAGVDVVDRSRIVEVQERLAGVQGVTVLINDQECAAELRRARRRGTVPVPGTRVVINHRICEGCGDCGDVSNCLSVQPMETPLGRKTRIDQATCNFDFSCVEGDCPAFMEVEVGDLGEVGPAGPPDVPDPAVAPVEGLVPIRLAGIGGTGVVSAAQILATAAMFDGWQVGGLDQTGLSQKAGPVISDLVLSGGAVAESNLVGSGEAAVLLAFDQLVAASDPVLTACDPGSTVTIVSTDQVPTGAMIGRPEIPFPADEARRRVASVSARTIELPAATLAEELAGDRITANILLLGAAVQEGLLPVGVDSLVRAIELNGVAVEANTAAFQWGRAWVADREAVERRLADRRLSAGETVTVPTLPASLHARIRGMDLGPVEEHVSMLAADLTGYQDEAYAARFLGALAPVAEADARDDERLLTRTAASSLHKLMAYKDEYEVARLMLLPEARVAAEEVGGRDAKVTWLLDPPVLVALGRDRKSRFGARSRWMFRALRAAKRLRGTALDPFGRTEVRRLERLLVDEFEAALATVVGSLRELGYDEAVRIVGLPDRVRGFEDLKLRRAEEYRSELARALAGG